MSDRSFHIKISPENINTIYGVQYTDGFITGETISDDCCDVITTTTTIPNTGITYVYSSMTQILSGGDWWVVPINGVNDTYTTYRNSQ